MRPLPTSAPSVPSPGQSRLIIELQQCVLAQIKLLDPMASGNPIPSGPSRKKLAILLTAVILVLFALLLAQTSFDLPFINPANNQAIVVFGALSAVVFLLFATLTFVLMRNLFKLFAERRLGVLGSKFRTRLVVGSLLLSFIP